MSPASILRSSTSIPGSIGYSGSNVSPSMPNNSIYWPIWDEAQTDSFSNNVTKESCERGPETGTGCRLFGIQLIESSTIEETSPSATIMRGVEEDHPLPSFEADSDRQTQPSNVVVSDVPAASSDLEKSCLRSPQETQSRQIRSCTKVHMQGMAVGRAVDLTRLEQYDDLLLKLEEMFNIEGELLGPVKKWQVAYTDDEDDMILVGDDPWHEFCCMVRKIYIHTNEKAKRLTTRGKLPVFGGTLNSGSYLPSTDGINGVGAAGHVDKAATASDRQCFPRLGKTQQAVRCVP